MHSAPSHKAKALEWCGATLHEPGWSVEHTRHARHTRPPRKTVLFTTQQASAVSCCSALAGLTSTRLTLGHETRSSGRCSGSAAASRSMRERPGLGLLCVLHAFPRACCVIGTTALLCAMPLKAALFSTEPHKTHAHALNQHTAHTATNTTMPTHQTCRNTMENTSVTTSHKSS